MDEFSVDIQISILEKNGITGDAYTALNVGYCFLLSGLFFWKFEDNNVAVLNIFQSQESKQRKTSVR